MKRDIIGDIFLGGVLLSLLFLFSFPAYFCYTTNAVRDVYLLERLMSVCFILGLIMGIVWTCWKKKVWVMLGISAFGLLAYLPKWFLPGIERRLAKPGKNIVDTILSMFLQRIYELTHAPFTGLIGMFSEKQAENLPYLILPGVVIAYLLSKVVRFYHQAYVTEKKQIHDFDHFRKANEVRNPTLPFAPEPEAPSPLGTIVLNEKAEVAAEHFPLKNQDTEQTVMHNLASEEAPAISGGEQPTEVIALAAHAPSSRQEEETQVIALAAHSPSTPIELPATSPSKAIELPARAPTSAAAPIEEDSDTSDTAEAPVPDTVSESGTDTDPADVREDAPEENPVTGPEDAPAKEPAQAPEETAPEDDLDFPDVHGEAEKIDVFGDDE